MGHAALKYFLETSLLNWTSISFGWVGFACKSMSK